MRGPRTVWWSCLTVLVGCVVCPASAQPREPGGNRDPDALPQEAEAIELHGGAMHRPTGVRSEPVPPTDPFRQAVRPDDGAPLVIAHRGASRYLPEHTLAAYAAAYFMGADVIEPDVMLTRDGVPICSHDITLDAATDAAQKFPGRARDDGKHYAIDFTLAEIKTLANLGRDGRGRKAGHTVATLDEMIGLVRGLNTQTGRTVGIIPEPKRPGFHRSAGQPIEEPLLDLLSEHGYAGPDDGCVVQCFDLDSIERMRSKLGSSLPMAFLIGEEVDRATLVRARLVCGALGPKKSLLMEQRGGVWTGLPTLAMARELGFALYPWAFGDDIREISAFFQYGVDGVFTDSPDSGVAGRTAGLEFPGLLDCIGG